MKKLGNEETKTSICVNNFKINLFKRLPKFEKYDTICMTKKLKLFSNLYLPVQLITEKYYELQENRVTYTIEEAENILINKLENELSVEVGENKNIINKQINKKNEDNSVEVEVIYEVLENIGTKEKIIN